LPASWPGLVRQSGPDQSASASHDLQRRRPGRHAYIAKLLIDAVVRAIAVNADPSLPATVTFGR